MSKKTLPVSRLFAMAVIRFRLSSDPILERKERVQGWVTMT